MSSALPPATQTPRDTYQWDTSGVKVQPIDMHQNIYDQINEYDYAMADLYGQANGVLNGLLISAASTGPAPMQFSVSTGRARVLNALKIAQLVTAGIQGQPATFNFSPTNGVAITPTWSRIDIIALQFSYTSYTDGNNEDHLVDTTSIQVIVGTPALNPVAPVLPGVDYVQLGTITVHSGDTSSSQAAIDNTLRTTYNPIGTIQSQWKPGDIKSTGAQNLESGWLYCDGSSYVRTGIYANLFAAIGTKYGAADGSHFNVPDIRDSVIMGPDSMGGGASRGLIASLPGLGASGGEATHVLLLAELASHNHPDTGHGHSFTDGGHNHLQNAHNHGITDAGHIHSITDGGHNHTQISHTHIDAGHSHTISDGGHVHQPTPTTHAGNGGTSTGYSINYGNTQLDSDRNTTANTTGIGINSGVASLNGTVAANQSSGSGITNNSGTTGVSVNNQTPTNQTATTGATVGTGTSNNSSAGSNTAHNNLQPYTVCNVLIKL